MVPLAKFKRTKFFRKLIYMAVGVASYPGVAIMNRLRISGTEHLKGLPKKNVLFVSNHQTYFADVITILHIFSAVKWRKIDRLGLPYYLLNPFTDVYYVASAETMGSSWISRFFTMAGALTVRRAWKGDKRKGLDPSDTRKISRALQQNWIIQFPQGTTTPFAPGRKGTAYLIKKERPIVIPVMIDGFNRAFDKKGLRLKKRGTVLSVQFKPSMPVDYDASVEEILDQVMTAIGQKR